MDDKQKKNLFTNKVKMDFLNPYKKELREEYKKKQQENKDKHAEIVKKDLKEKEHILKYSNHQPNLFFQRKTCSCSI